MLVEGTNLSMTRGDSESITVVFKRDGVAVPLVAGDTVYFTIKNKYTDIEKVLQKIVTEFVGGIAEIIIDPVDTKQLEFKTFTYDVQVTFANGSVKTIIKASSFKVTKEVTYE